MEKKNKKKWKKVKSWSSKRNKKKKNNSYEFINLLSESNNDFESLNLKFPSFNIIRCIYNIFLFILALLMLIFLHSHVRRNIKEKKKHSVLYKNRYVINNNKNNQTENLNIFFNASKLNEKN